MSRKTARRGRPHQSARLLPPPYRSHADRQAARAPWPRDRAKRRAKGSVLDSDPGGSVIAGLLAAAIFLVDAGIEQSIGGQSGEQKMIDAKARVALPAPGGVIPEGVDGAIRIAGTDRVGKAEV